MAKNGVYFFPNCNPVAALSIIMPSCNILLSGANIMRLKPTKTNIVVDTTSIKQRINSLLIYASLDRRIIIPPLLYLLYNSFSFFVHR